MSTDPSAAKPLDFVRAKVTADVQSQRFGRQVMTRFPPEPNGYLHIGHAKAICLDFGIAQEFGGVCNLRFDDTNPEKEDIEFVEAIQRDLRWLGFDWGDRMYFASDYYDRLYAMAEDLIQRGLAYVDSVDLETLRELRGTVTEPGTPSEYRDRSVEENLDLFRRMKAGEFDEGEHVLRAKIDLAHPNMKMRDPLIYRIRHAHHFRKGSEWCIYPMYDYAHGISDAIEGVTHSLCTLEFENNRDLYDWFVQAVGFDKPPEQTEFAKLQLTYVLLSKRNLRKMVEEGLVDGWDDPRMPTMAGLRRRGVPPEAVRRLADDVGVAKSNSVVDLTRFDNAIRDVLNHEAPRVMAVLRPLKVTVTTWEEGEVDWLDAPLYPHDVPKEGSRKVAFSRTIYIERTDFEEEPPKGFKRLVPGGEVRLRYGYFLRCDEVVKDPDTGVVLELRCSHDPTTRGGANPADGRKVKGTIHWVSEVGSAPAKVRLYDRLFRVEQPGAEGDWRDDLNPRSLVVLYGCRVETSIADDPAGTCYQFERQGYFCADEQLSQSGKLVYNRIVSLKDGWGKKAAAPAPAPKAQAKPDPKPGPAGEAAALPPEVQAVADGLVERGLSADDARVLAQNPELIGVLDQAAEVGGDLQAAANWVVNDLRAATKETLLADLKVGGAQIGGLVKLVAAKTISTRTARDVFAAMLAEGGDPAAIVEARGLAQVSDESALREAIVKVLQSKPKELAAYRGGKKQLRGFFVGQVMRATKGRANPKLVQSLLTELLDQPAE